MYCILMMYAILPTSIWKTYRLKEEKNYLGSIVTKIIFKVNTATDVLTLFYKRQV